MDLLGENADSPLSEDLSDGYYLRSSSSSTTISTTESSSIGSSSIESSEPSSTESSEPLSIESLDNNNEDTNISSSSQSTTSTIIPSDKQEKEEAEEQEERPCKKPKLNETVDEDGSLCIICLETWSQTGEHRIASLKCGHLFGHRCILRWLSDNRVCPSCKTKANKRDIRFIYANKLVAMDTGELTRLQKQLEKVMDESMNLQIENTSVLCKLSFMSAQLEKYKLKVQELMSSQTLPKVSVKNFSLKFIDSFTVCPQGSCRVMDYLASKTSIVASVTSSNNLFPGFGVKHFNTETNTLLRYIPLHNKPIRDLRFNQANAKLLSVSLDKSFGISNIFSTESKLKQSCDDMLWSCCWDNSNPNQFLIGGQQGSIKIYDIRYITDSPVSTHNVEGDMSPVVSIISIPSSAGSALPHGGFIACKLNSLWAFETCGSTAAAIKSQLPIEGPFVSMTYSNEDQHLLISARPNPREPMARHIICNLRKDEDKLTCDRIHTFTSGKMQKQLARSCFITEEGTNYVATPNDNVVQLWNCETGFPVTNARTCNPIIDLLPIKQQEKTRLVALGEKKLSVFKFIDS